MIKNIIFDFGAVLVDWNPRRVYDPYFGSDTDKEDFFLGNVCNSEWNAQMDCGKPFAVAVEERIKVFPEWEKEIRMYKDRWMGMMGDAISGMFDVVKSLKDKGYGIYGLTNWSSETFYKVEPLYPVFSLLDGKVVSGDVKLLKPDIRIYESLLAKYSLEASESIFIDDNPANVEGAQEAGIQGIVFTNAESLKEQLGSLLKSTESICCS